MKWNPSFIQNYIYSQQRTPFSCSRITAHFWGTTSANGLRFIVFYWVESIRLTRRSERLVKILHLKWSCHRILRQVTIGVCLRLVEQWIFNWNLKISQNKQWTLLMKELKERISSGWMDTPSADRPSAVVRPVWWQLLASFFGCIYTMLCGQSTGDIFEAGEQRTRLGKHADTYRG